MNINMNIIDKMKVISMVDLRTQSERIIRDLKRGERMMLSYRGKPLAELVPASLGARVLSPLEALNRAHKLSSSPGAVAEASVYLKELRADQRSWSERQPS